MCTYIVIAQKQTKLMVSEKTSNRRMTRPSYQHLVAAGVRTQCGAAGAALQGAESRVVHIASVSSAVLHDPSSKLLEMGWNMNFVCIYIYVYICRVLTERATGLHVRCFDHGSHEDHVNSRIIPQFGSKAQDKGVPEIMRFVGSFFVYELPFGPLLEEEPTGRCVWRLPVVVRKGKASPTKEKLRLLQALLLRGTR